MSTGEPTVFWVCGAPGAGKSVAAWALFEALAADGVRVGYVDIDQLGMLYPANSEDPQRHLLTEEALLALLPGYASAGAQVLLVSGVLDPEVGPAAVAASGVDLTLCLLLPDPAALRERILGRGSDQKDADQAVAENAALREATFIDATLDTARLSVAATVQWLRPLVRVNGPSSLKPSSWVRSAADLGVVVVTGPRAVGSSTVGFALAMDRWRQERTTGFVDLQQLAFLSGPGSAGTTATLAIAQLAVMHSFLAAHGAGLLVVSGHLGVKDRRALRDSLPAASITVVRLRADATTFEDHVRDRRTGSGARLAGDDLLRADRAYLATVVADALADQDHLDAHADDDALLDVTDRPPVHIVAAIKALTTSRDP